MMQATVLGLGFQDATMFFIRLILGGFFVLYRFRWVYDPSATDRKWFSPSRKSRLIDRLYTCGYSANPLLAALVALGEIAAGLAVIVGFLTVPAAMVLLVILVFANCCTPREEIPLMKPVDKLDVLRCYLHLAEPLYLILAIGVIFIGPGMWSLDHWIVYPMLKAWGWL